MYIPEFWCGVIATVLSIIGCSLISDAVSRIRDRKRKNDETTEKADSKSKRVLDCALPAR